MTCSPRSSRARARSKSPTGGIAARSQQVGPPSQCGGGPTFIQGPQPCAARPSRGMQVHPFGRWTPVIWQKASPSGTVIVRVVGPEGSCPSQGQTIRYADGHDALEGAKWPQVRPDVRAQGKLTGKPGAIWRLRESQSWAFVIRGRRRRAMGTCLGTHLGPFRSHAAARHTKGTRASSVFYPPTCALWGRGDSYVRSECQRERL